MKFRTFLVLIGFIFSTNIVVGEEVPYSFKVNKSIKIIGPFLKKIGQSWSIEVLEEFVDSEFFVKPVYTKMLARVEDAGKFKGCDSLNVGEPKKGYPDPKTNVAVAGKCNFENKMLAVVVFMRVYKNTTKVTGVIIGNSKNT